jgi:hypothetical protein
VRMGQVVSLESKEESLGLPRFLLWYSIDSSGAIRNPNSRLIIWKAEVFSISCLLWAFKRCILAHFKLVNSNKP